MAATLTDLAGQPCDGVVSARLPAGERLSCRGRCCTPRGRRAAARGSAPRRRRSRSGSAPVQERRLAEVLADRELELVDRPPRSSPQRIRPSSSVTESARPSPSRRVAPRRRRGPPAGGVEHVGVEAHSASSSRRRAILAISPSAVSISGSRVLPKRASAFARIESLVVLAYADHEREAEPLAVGGVGGHEALVLRRREPVQPEPGLLARASAAVEHADLLAEVRVGADQRELALAAAAYIAARSAASSSSTPSKPSAARRPRRPTATARRARRSARRTPRGRHERPFSASGTSSKASTSTSPRSVIFSDGITDSARKESVMNGASIATPCSRSSVLQLLEPLDDLLERARRRAARRPAAPARPAPRRPRDDDPAAELLQRAPRTAPCPRRRRRPPRGCARRGRRSRRTRRARSPKPRTSPRPTRPVAWWRSITAILARSRAGSATTAPSRTAGSASRAR